MCRPVTLQIMASMISYIMNRREQFYVVRKILSIIAVLGEILVSRIWWALFPPSHPFFFIFFSTRSFFSPPYLRRFAFIYRFIKLSSSILRPETQWSVGVLRLFFTRLIRKKLVGHFYRFKCESS